MKNRPLLSVCLMVLCIIASMVVWGRERFIKELRPSPIERYAACLLYTSDAADEG